MFLLHFQCANKVDHFHISIWCNAVVSFLLISVSIRSGWFCIQRINTITKWHSLINKLLFFEKVTKALCNSFSELFHLRIELRCAQKRFVASINILRNSLFFCAHSFNKVDEKFYQKPFLSLFLNEQISFWHKSSIQVPYMMKTSFRDLI